MWRKSSFWKLNTFADLSFITENINLIKCCITHDLIEISPFYCFLHISSFPISFSIYTVQSSFPHIKIIPKWLLPKTFLRISPPHPQVRKRNFPSDPPVRKSELCRQWWRVSRLPQPVGRSEYIKARSVGRYCDCTVKTRDIAGLESVSPRQFVRSWQWLKIHWGINHLILDKIPNKINSDNTWVNYRGSRK